MSPSDEIANWELFLWALASLGASDHFVDVEDASLECFRIAPARFSWRTRSDLPDYKKCSKALQEAEARVPRLLVKAGDPFARQLTAEGQKWITENTMRLGAVLQAGAPVPEPSRRATSRLLAEIERSGPFAQWRETETVPPEKWRIAEVLRCSPDSSPHTWRERLESTRAVAYASKNTAVLRFLDTLPRLHPDWFGA